MMKSVISRLKSAVVMAVAATLGIAAHAVEATYIDADGNEQTAESVVVTSSTTTFTDGGWYVVNGAVTTGMITVNGTANLILADGATLTATGTAKYDPGVKVTSGNTLIIYAQSEGDGAGALVATGKESKCAGIGGGSVNNVGQACGTVKIYGGNITATGVKGAAGIGGGAGGSDSGSGGAGGTVEIYGGTVTATAGAVNGSSYGAGIGGGVANNNRADNGTLTVAKGMTVMAGTDAGSATARTPDAETGAVTISTSGTADRYFKITAPTALTQSVSDLGEVEQGAVTNWNLAATLEGNVAPYTFSGTAPEGFSFTDAGVLTLGEAAGGVYNIVLTAAGSGAPRLSKPVEFTWTVTILNAPKTITYKDGEETLNLAPAQYNPGVAVTLPTPTKPGYDFGGWYFNAEFNGEPVTEVATTETEDKIFFSKWTAHVYSITYMEGNTTLTGIEPATYTIEAAATLPESYTEKAGQGFYGWFDNAATTGTEVTEIPAGSTGDKVFYAKWGQPWTRADYIDAAGNAANERCVVVTTSTRTLEGGNWYVVTENTTISGTLTVSGSVNLILADGAKLTVTATGSNYMPGIHVASGNTLTIYAQGEGTGAIEATGVARGAGIGGQGSNSGTIEACGNVTIYGGHITATGGQNAAGIGGGGNTTSGTGTRRGGNGGTVKVYGGTVTATGGAANAAGIGAGTGRTTTGTSQGTLTVATGMIVKVGASANPTASATINENGEVTLSGSNSRYFTISEPGALVQSESALDYAVESIPDEWDLAASISGGVPGYTFAGEPPEGFELTAAGVLSTLATAKAGDYAITLTVTDSGAGRLRKSVEFTWTVTLRNAPESIVYMDGEATLTGLEPETYNPGVEESLATAVPEKTGYTFFGWYDNAELLGDAVTAVPTSATGTQTFYAKWTAIVYNIVYMDGSTTLNLAPASYTIEDVVELPAATKTDKVFDGWYDNSGLTGDAVTGIALGTTGDKTFYAKFVPAKAPATYIDADGDEQTAPECITVDIDDPDTYAFEDGGWYVVKGDVTFTSTLSIPAGASVNLILADGATLTATAASSGTTSYNPGIAVPATSTLSIYAQGEGSGAIVATGTSRGAGIGGSGNGGSCGTINIYGGNITATGTQYGAGIGGAGTGSSGTGGAGGTVTIYGGSVTATGGANSAAIGGGRNASSQGTVTVAEGMIDTTSGYTRTITEPAPLTQSVSALENGVEGAGTTWNLAEMVTGGVAPYAFSGEAPEGFSFTEAGVLTLGEAKGGDYSITLTVTDSGSKRFVQSKEFTWTVTILNAPKTITYKDGEETLTGLAPTQYNPGVEKSIETAVPTKTGYTFAGWYANAELTGDAVTAVGTDATEDLTFYAKWTAVSYNIVYMDGTSELKGLTPASYTIEDTVTLPETAEKPGYGFYGWYTDAEFTGDEVTTIAEGTTGPQTFYAKWGDPWVAATYIGADGKEATAKSVVVTTSTTTFEDGGWYVVNGNVTTGTITVNGTANLILADGATLTATGTAKYDPGIRVSVGNTLSIYAQSAGTGALVASGNGSKAAGIGGGSLEEGKTGESCGTVRIYGGNITANGVKGAAGIGGGAGSGSDNTKKGGDGGTVEVYGGIVKATGGADNGTGRVGGAGIGSGDAAGGVTTGGTFVNYGGTVIATGIDGAADIGAADGGASATFMVLGGSTYLANGTTTAAATDGNGNAVYCVTVPGLTASTKYVFDGLGGYGQANIVSDAGGNAYLWLQNGPYSFTEMVSYAHYTATVASAATTAVMSGAITDDSADQVTVGYMDGTTAVIERTTDATITIPETAEAIDIVISGNEATLNSTAEITLANLTVHASDAYGVKQETVITGAFKVTGSEGAYVIELDPKATVEVGGKVVKVEPQIDTAYFPPIGITDEDVDFAVKTIPGLWYGIKTSSTLDGTFEVMLESVMQAEGTTSHVTVPMGTEPVMFYQVSIAPSKAGLE